MPHFPLVFSQLPSVLFVSLGLLQQLQPQLTQLAAGLLAERVITALSLLQPSKQLSMLGLQVGDNGVLVAKLVSVDGVEMGFHVPEPLLGLLGLRPGPLLGRADLVLGLGQSRLRIRELRPGPGKVLGELGGVGVEPGPDDSVAACAAAGFDHFVDIGLVDEFELGHLFLVGLAQLSDLAHVFVDLGLVPLLPLLALPLVALRQLCDLSLEVADFVVAQQPQLLILRQSHHPFLLHSLQLLLHLLQPRFPLLLLTAFVLYGFLELLVSDLQLLLRLLVLVFEVVCLGAHHVAFELVAVEPGLALLEPRLDGLGSVQAGEGKHRFVLKLVLFDVRLLHVDGVPGRLLGAGDPDPELVGGELAEPGLGRCFDIVEFSKLMEYLCELLVQGLDLLGTHHALLEVLV